MEEISLKEMCRKYGLSRRTVQNYEHEGLVMPTGKTNRGYLLYDEKTIYRILLIRFLQNIGYQVKEIGLFIDDPYESIKEKIEVRIPKLKDNLRNMEELLKKSKKAVELLEKEDKEEFIHFIERGEENEKSN